MTAPVDSRVTGRYSLGPVKSWVEQALTQLGIAHGIRTIGGYRSTSAVANSDHPRGLAGDLMITSKAQGDALAADAVANAIQLGIKYVIWWDRIWTPSQGWHAYTATPYNPHHDHVHISFQDRPGTGGYVKAGTPSGAIGGSDADTCAWKIGGANLDIPDFLPGPNEIGTGEGVCVISKKQLRQTLGGLLLVASGVTLAVGLIVLVVYGMQQSQAGRSLTGVVGVVGSVGRRVLPTGRTVQE